MSTRSITKGKAIGLSAAIIGAVAITVIGIVVFTSPGQTTPPPRVMVSEIKYTSEGASPLQDQFIELYSFVNHTNDMFSGWFIETRDSSGSVVLSKTPIPQVTGLGHFWHLLILGDEGATVINASAKHATVHLNIAGTFLNQSAGQVILSHQNNPVVADFVCYGAVQTPVNLPANNMWSSTDTGASVTNTSHSLNIWGPDEDDSSNWYSDMPTPGSFNNIIQDAEFTHPDASKENITQVMYNGFLAPTYLHATATPMLPPGPIIPGALPAVVTVDADPTAGVTAAEIREMVLKTMQILIAAGYKNGPQLGPDGAVDIHIGADTRYNSSYGLCYDNGSVYVYVGNEIRSNDATRHYRGKIDVKYTVEHEVTHTFQWKAGSIQDDNRNWNEGEATYWGAYSTAVNYNISVAQVNSIMHQIENWINGTNYPPQNWNDHCRNLNKSNWGAGNSPGNTGFTTSYDHYSASMMLIKFINETFGPGIYRNITNAVNATNPFRQAAEQATGLSWDDILTSYYKWRASGQATLDNGAPEVMSNEVFDPVSTSIGATIQNVAPQGAVVEDVNCSNVPSDEPFDVNVTVNPGQPASSGNFSIIVIATLTNGSTQTSTFKVASGSSLVIPIDPNSIGFVRIVKVNLNMTDVKPVSMEITFPVTQVPSIPPELPPDVYRPGEISHHTYTDMHCSAAYDSYYLVLTDYVSLGPSGIVNYSAPDHQWGGWFTINTFLIFTPGGIEQDPLTKLEVRFWVYNENGTAPVLRTGWFEPAALSDVVITVTSPGIVYDPVYIVAEIRDNNPFHTMAVFNFVFTGSFNWD